MREFFRVRDEVYRLYFVAGYSKGERREWPAFEIGDHPRIAVDLRHSLDQVFGHKFLQSAGDGARDVICRRHQIRNRRRLPAAIRVKNRVLREKGHEPLQITGCCRIEKLRQ